MDSPRLSLTPVLKAPLDDERPPGFFESIFNAGTGKNFFGVPLQDLSRANWFWIDFIHWRDLRRALDNLGKPNPIRSIIEAVRDHGHPDLVITSIHREEQGDGPLAIGYHGKRLAVDFGARGNLPIIFQAFVNLARVWPGGLGIGAPESVARHSGYGGAMLHLHVDARHTERKPRVIFVEMGYKPGDTAYHVISNTRYPEQFRALMPHVARAYSAPLSNWDWDYFVDNVVVPIADAATPEINWMKWALIGGGVYFAYKLLTDSGTRAGAIADARGAGRRVRGLLQ